MQPLDEFRLIHLGHQVGACSCVALFALVEEAETRADTLQKMLDSERRAVKELRERLETG
jgi:hypothetical protein